MALDRRNDFFFKAIEQRLEKEFEAELDNAVEEITARLRARVGEMALAVLSHYDVVKSRDYVTIRVKIDTED